MTVTLTDGTADDCSPPVQPWTDGTNGGGADPPPVAVAMPWDDAWALVLPPGADLPSLANAVRRLPTGCQFVEAYGDVETVLVFRLAEQNRTACALPGAMGAELRPSAHAHPLTLVRTARAWSYESLARLLAAKARTLGVNMATERQKIWRWEHHGVTPHRTTQMILADLLDVPRGLVDARPWPAWLPTQHAPDYHRIVEDLTAEVEKGLRAIAALGYTINGGMIPQPRGMPRVRGVREGSSTPDWGERAFSVPAMCGILIHRAILIPTRQLRSCWQSRSSRANTTLGANALARRSAWATGTRAKTTSCTQIRGQECSSATRRPVWPRSPPR